MEEKIKIEMTMTEWTKLITTAAKVEEFAKCFKFQWDSEKKLRSEIEELKKEIEELKNKEIQK